LDKILRENGTGYLVGTQLTFVDLVWWYHLDNLSDQGVIDVSKYEHVAKFKASIESRPNIAAYIKNPKRYPVQPLVGKYVIHSYPGNPNVFKAIVAAEYAGIKVEYPQNFQMGVENKTSDFLVKNPNGQVPTMDTPDGPLYESNAIAKYIARKGSDKGLYGSSDFDAASIDQWVEWYRSKLEDEVGAMVVQILGREPYNKEKFETAKANVTKYFGILNSHLEGREWIVGKRTTLADIILFCSLARGLANAFDHEFLKAFPNVSAWAQRCTEQPQFKVAWPKFEFSVKAKTFE